MNVTETNRLIIRRFELSNHAAMTRVFGDAEVMRFGDGPQSAEWVHGWLEKCLERYERWGYGPWAVVEKSGGEVIGYCGLFYFPDVNGRPEVEIGYRLACAYWGRGYATEAVIAARDYAFNALGLTRLIALIDPGNAASIHVAEKAGMRYEADVMLPGYTHPDRLYAIMIGDSQAYFKTAEWQQAEQEAQADIDAGRMQSFDSVEKLMADLDSGSQDSLRP